VRADVPWLIAPTMPLALRLAARAAVSVLTTMLVLPVPSGICPDCAFW
jgi:hypothetical protein